MRAEESFSGSGERKSSRTKRVAKNRRRTRRVSLVESRQDQRGQAGRYEGTEEEKEKEVEKEVAVEVEEVEGVGGRFHRGAKAIVCYVVMGGAR